MLEQEKQDASAGENQEIASKSSPLYTIRVMGPMEPLIPCETEYGEWMTSPERKPNHATAELGNAVESSSMEGSPEESASAITGGTAIDEGSTGSRESGSKRKGSKNRGNRRGGKGKSGKGKNDGSSESNTNPVFGSTESGEEVYPSPPRATGLPRSYSAPANLTTSSFECVEQTEHLEASAAPVDVEFYETRETVPSSVVSAASGMKSNTPKSDSRSQAILLPMPPPKAIKRKGGFPGTTPPQKAKKKSKKSCKKSNNTHNKSNKKPAFTIRILTGLMPVSRPESAHPTASTPGPSSSVRSNGSTPGPSPESHFDPLSPYNSSSFLMGTDVHPGIHGQSNLGNDNDSSPMNWEYGSMDYEPCENLYGEWMESPTMQPRPNPEDLIDDDELYLGDQGVYDGDDSACAASKIMGE